MIKMRIIDVGNVLQFFIQEFVDLCSCPIIFVFVTTKRFDTAIFTCFRRYLLLLEGGDIYNFLRTARIAHIWMSAKLSMDSKITPN